MEAKELFRKYATISTGVLSTWKPLEEESLMTFSQFQKAFDEIVSRVELPVKPEIADIDKGLGKCMEKNCNKFATTDYNGHKHYVCAYHDEKLNRDFDEDYQ